MPTARKTELGTLADVFRASLFDALRSEPFRKEAVTFFGRHFGEHVLGRTNSRRVLGSLVDLRYQLLVFLDSQAELGPPQFAAAGRLLNRVPMSFLKYGYPVDAMQALVADEPA